LIWAFKVKAMDKNRFRNPIKTALRPPRRQSAVENGLADFDAHALTQGSLVSKVALLTSVSFMFLAAGSMFGIKIEPNMFLWIASLVITFGGLFLLPLVRSPISSMVGLAIWNSVFGVIVGFGLQGYIETIGANTVAVCLAGTAGAMAVVGSIGAFSGVDFRPMQRFLMFALFGLILVVSASSSFISPLASILSMRWVVWWSLLGSSWWTSAAWPSQLTTAGLRQLTSPSVLFLITSISPSTSCASFAN
jgi:FtsH-binding integral membrane protein